MKYLVKNWDHFQHYRDRNPPWIKLHFDILASADWVTLDDTSRVLAIACMLIASRSKENRGEIDGSDAGLAYLKRVAYLNKTPNLKPLILSGFLVPASECKQMLADASLSVSVSSVYVSEDKGCGEKGKAAKLPYGEFQNVKLSEHELKKLETRFGKDDMWRRIESLSQYIASKGKQYKDFYATILQWAAREPASPPPPKGEFDHLPTIDYPCWICGCRIDPPETCALKWHGMTADQYADGEWEHPREVTA